MSANTLPDAALSLGHFLRDRRARLAPEIGAGGRRRTPGLRREEVATRACVSVTWYTWLEQGRGGPPSDEVLERLARALELDGANREVLFLLAQQRPPPLKPSRPPQISPNLQRVLDAMPTSPAYVKTPAWDILAWNAAAAAVLSNFALAPASERNALKNLFGHLTANKRPDWEETARFALSVFRVDTARVGGSPRATALAAELHETSADFRRLWAEQDMRGHWAGLKHLTHPVAGPLALEYSTFAVDGSEGLSLVVFSPATPADAAAIAALVAQSQ